MNYQECLNYLDGLGQELRGVRFGLQPISAILGSLGRPHLKYPTAIIAGTNGKGSTSAILASNSFMAAGATVGRPVMADDDTTGAGTYAFARKDRDHPSARRILCGDRHGASAH